MILRTFVFAWQAVETLPAVIKCVTVSVESGFLAVRPSRLHALALKLSQRLCRRDACTTKSRLHRHAPAVVAVGSHCRLNRQSGHIRSGQFKLPRAGLAVSTRMERRHESTGATYYLIFAAPVNLGGDGRGKVGKRR